MRSTYAIIAEPYTGLDAAIFGGSQSMDTKGPALQSSSSPGYARYNPDGVGSADHPGGAQGVGATNVEYRVSACTQERGSSPEEIVQSLMLHPNRGTDTESVRGTSMVNR